MGGLDGWHVVCFGALKSIWLNPLRVSYLCYLLFYFHKYVHIGTIFVAKRNIIYCEQHITFGYLSHPVAIYWRLESILHFDMSPSTLAQQKSFHFNGECRVIILLYWRILFEVMIVIVIFIHNALHEISPANRWHTAPYHYWTFMTWCHIFRFLFYCSQHSPTRLSPHQLSTLDAFLW